MFLRMLFMLVPVRMPNDARAFQSFGKGLKSCVANFPAPVPCDKQEQVESSLVQKYAHPETLPWASPH